MNQKQKAWLRNILMICGLLLAAAPALVRAQPQTTLAVSPETAEIALGDTHEVTLVVTDAVDLNAFDVTVTYDPAVLELVCEYGNKGTACWESGGFLQNLQVVVLRNKLGEFFIAVTQITTDGQNGDGDLMRLTFRGIEHGSSAVTISRAEFADPGGDVSHPARQHGEIAAKMVPTALGDVYEMAKASTLAVSVAEGVLANDSGGPGAELTAELLDGPNIGQLDLVPDGAFTYTPPEDFVGMVGFTYRACDGTICSDPAAVSVAVKTVPTTAADAYEGAENADLVVGPEEGVLANDSGDPGADLTAELVEDVPDGEGTLALGADGGFVYSPPEDWTGTTSFNYRACDGLICSEPAPVTLAIKTVPIAQDNAYEMAANTTLAVDAPGVLANDSGGEGAQLQAILAGPPDPDVGALNLAETGDFTYTPPEDWAGVVSFPYQACDGMICSETASVTIAVKTVPTAVDDAYEMTINETLIVPSPGILDNDSGDPGAVLRVDVLSELDPDIGELQVAEDGGLTYTPPADWRGVVGFTYRACDGMICSDAASVTIEVFPPRVPLSGTITLQGQPSNHGGVPVVLVGQEYGYIYEVETFHQAEINLVLDKVVIDTYLLITAQPRYLNLHPELGITITVTDDVLLPPLKLLGGNAVWTDNVINIGDASVIGAYYHLTLDDLPAEELLGDVNFDGIVNIYDLAMVGGNYWLTSDMAYAGWLD